MSALSLTHAAYPYAARSQTTNPKESGTIASAQRGDVSAFNQLVNAYQGLAYRTAYHLLGDGDAAADATQDAFIAAYTHLPAFHNGSFRAWLLRIVTNSCYNQLRYRRRKPAVSLDALAVEQDHAASEFLRPRQESPHEFAERQELARLLQTGLDALPAEQRATCVLSDIDGFSYEEIAQITGAQVGTVKSRLSRGRARLREFLLEAM